MCFFPRASRGRLYEDAVCKVASPCAAGGGRPSARRAAARRPDRHRLGRLVRRPNEARNLWRRV